MFGKALSCFDKRQIVRSCPRPNVDCVYTPVLDKFLPDLVPSQPLKTSQESSSWYRYVPRTFFKTHSLKITYRGQTSTFLSKLAAHYQRPLGSENCGGVQDRVPGITSPDLHSHRTCIRGGGSLHAFPLDWPVVDQLRKIGIRLIMYLDDMLTMAESRVLTLEHTTIAVNLLSSLGFVLNKGKSILVPTQELELLGFLVNSIINLS